MHESARKCTVSTNQQFPPAHLNASPVPLPTLVMFHVFMFHPYNPPPMPDNDVVKSNLLIVDDEEDHAQVMCEALQRLGHRCDVTFNLPEARARMEKKTYDVIVTDLLMRGKRDALQA